MTLYVLYNKETGEFGKFNTCKFKVVGAVSTFPVWESKDRALHMLNQFKLHCEFDLDMNGFSLYEYNGQLGKEVK